MIDSRMDLHCICGADDFARVFTYEAPPAGETLFEFSRNGSYRREIVQCARCRHFVSRSSMDMSSLYDHDYVSGTYGGADGLRRAFDRITALPPERSDNVGRVRRVVGFAAEYLAAPAAEKRRPRVLDVGSGLGVFPHRMVEAGWDCLALDTDQRLVDHLRDHIGVRAVCGRFGEVGELGRFDAVTINKVLEHVEDPVSFLAKSSEYVAPEGFVYVEVPDGEAAASEGKGREEFFVEHHHVFSFSSLALAAQMAGFIPILMERLREPSTKFTLRAFLAPRA